MFGESKSKKPCCAACVKAKAKASGPMKQDAAPPSLAARLKLSAKRKPPKKRG